MSTGLYVHVPFCRSRCTYCDFYRLPYGSGIAERYLDALEVEVRGLPADFAPSTIYVGGGTPSCLSDGQLERLLTLLAPLRGAAREFTVELNPESATEARIRLLAASGVTRASLGVQSLRPHVLELLGRPHGPEEALGACRRLREHIPDLSVDLIFAIPGQTASDWNGDLAGVLGVGPDHVSVYGLTWAPGSRLTRRLRLGEVSRVAEETERAMFLRAIEVLSAAGFEHYEVSNFARPGHQSLHNLGYWLQRDYVGLGPGASSTLGSRRHRNAPDVDAYVRGLLERGMPPREEELLSPRDVLNEAVLLGLRTRTGVSLGKIREAAGGGMPEGTRGFISTLLHEGLALVEDDRLRLTAEGLCVADRIILGFMA